MLKDDLIQKILHEYDEKYSLHSAFTTKQEHLICELLHERSFAPHSVTSRVKTRQSLQDKLSRPDAVYAQLSDVTDISGVRITTYFSDDVDKIAEHLDREFEIVKEYSVDKRKTMDADRFGYLSLHYVAKLPGERLKLTEYRRFPNLLCEIQIRSILQHAWAEIEHDLGYKTRTAVPQALRRRFSRLAGLLELADEEFITIRNALTAYRDKLPEEIKKSPATITLDKLSLAQFLKSNPVAKNLDTTVASYFGATLYDDDRALENDLIQMNFLGIKTISELEASLQSNRELILKFSKSWIGSLGESQIVRGISLLYLGYVLVAQSGSRDYALRFLNEGNIGGEHDEVLKDIFTTYAEAEVEF